jgi:hypothetical protein
MMFNIKAVEQALNLRAVATGSEAAHA